MKNLARDYRDYDEYDDSNYQSNYQKINKSKQIWK